MAHPIIVAQDALKALLTARPAFNGVDVRDSAPTEIDDKTFGAFWFDEVTIESEGWGELGNPVGGNRRRSNFTLAFTLATRKYGDDERAARAAVLDLYEDLQATIKANPALGVPAAIQTTGPVTGTLASVPIPQQWAAQFVGSLDVTSKLY
jgi:hypothetical protein